MLFRFKLSQAENITYDDFALYVNKSEADKVAFLREELQRSEERRVGKECRSRWWRDH